VQAVGLEGASKCVEGARNYFEAGGRADLNSEKYGFVGDFDELWQQYCELVQRMR
jgi:hypothetical protein